MKKYLRFFLFLFFCIASLSIGANSVQAQNYRADRQDDALEKQRQGDRQQVLDRLKNQRARQNQENDEVRAAVPYHLQNRVYVQQNQVRRLQPRLMLLLGPDKKRYTSPIILNLLNSPTTPDGEPYRIMKSLAPDSYGLNPNDFFV